MRLSPLAGQAGLEAAVEEGVLRPATEADIKAWMELQQKLHPKKDISRPAIASEYPDAYVVSGDFTYPNGISGGISTFMIPKNVPKPNGNPFDSTIYDFKTGKCSGLFCDF